MASLGELVVFLSANSESLRQGMESAAGTVKSKTKGMASSTASASKSIAKSLAGIGTAALKMSVSIVKSTGASASSILNLSNAASVGARDFQKYSIAADQVGVRGDELSRMFRRLNRSTGEEGPAALQRLVDAGQKAGKSQAEIAAEMETLERRSSRLLPLLLDGGKLLGELGENAEKTGQLMDENMVQTMDLANRQMKLWQDEMSGAKETIATGLWPELENLVNIFRHYVDEGAAVEGVTAALSGGLKVMGTIAAGLGGVIKAVGTGIGALAAAIVSLFEGDFTGAFDIAKEGFADIITVAKESANAMVDVWDGAKYEDKNKETLQRVQTAVLEFNRNTGEGVRGQNAEVVKALEELREKALGIGLTDAQALEKGFSEENAILREALEKRAITEEEFRQRAQQLEADHSIAIMDLRRAVLDFALTEQEQLAQQYEEREEALNEALAQELITHEEHQEAMLAARQQYEDAMTAIERSGQRARMQGLQTALNQGASLMTSSSRKMFEAGKVAALANAAIDMYSGIGKAWALGPILGPPMAALVGAAGVANIQNINRQKFGGGGGGVSSAPTASAPPISSGGGGAPSQNVYLHGIEPGMLYDGAQILDALNRQIEDGGRIVGVR